MISFILSFKKQPMANRDKKQLQQSNPPKKLLYETERKRKRGKKVWSHSPQAFFWESVGSLSLSLVPTNSSSSAHTAKRAFINQSIPTKKSRYFVQRATILCHGQEECNKAFTTTILKLFFSSPPRFEWDAWWQIVIFLNIVYVHCVIHGKATGQRSLNAQKAQLLVAQILGIHCRKIEKKWGESPKLGINTCSVGILGQFVSFFFVFRGHLNNH